MHNTNPKPELTRTNGFVEVLILGKGNFGMGNDYRWIETESSSLWSGWRDEGQTPSPNPFRKILIVIS